MDPNTARTLLRLDPVAPLTPTTVEEAFRAELWARHPSRYPDDEGRRAAVGWAETLGEARRVLLETIAPQQAFTQPPRPSRGLSGGWIAGIAATAAVLVLGLAAGIAFALPAVLDRMTLAAPVGGDGTGDDGVIHYGSGATAFTFPAELEYYTDGRFAADCPVEFEQGCWEGAIFPEADCNVLTVWVGFASDPSVMEPEETRTLRFTAIGAGELVPLVYGHDDYADAWITDVVCHDLPEA
ncbi:hypothetical protein ABIQ69_05955 [Agromyces sp. G08B096]|uniref:J domain-containing protein n=1 Tax=Agromyces sp. G08B096 TaxID=3156399 RepID=A0AAU7WCL8_9MICO